MRLVNPCYAMTIALLMASVAAAQDAVPWAPTLDAAMIMASRQNRLVLIHFWSPDCVPCRQLEQAVFSRPEVGQAIATQFIPVKVNGQQAQETARRYGVDRWPTEVVVTPADYVIDKYSPSMDPQQYVRQLQAIASAGAPPSQYAQGGPPAPSNYSAGPGPMGGGYPNNPPAQGGGYDSYGAGPGQEVRRSRFSEGFTDNYGAQPPADRFTGPLYQSQPAQQASAPPMYAGQPYSSTPPAGGPMGSNPSPWAQDQQSGAGGPPPWGASTGPMGPPTVSQGMQSPPVGPYQPNSPPPGMALSNVAGGYVGAGQMGPPPSAPNVSAPPASGANPPLGLDGYCPVSLAENTAWVKGDPKFGAVHRGTTYLFVGPVEQQRFLSDPDRYSPMLSGNDPVRFADQGQLVPGSRKHGVFFRNQVFLFGSEEALQQFWSSPQRYADVVRQAMIAADQQGRR